MFTKEFKIKKKEKIYSERSKSLKERERERERGSEIKRGVKREEQRETEGGKVR